MTEFFQKHNLTSNVPVSAKYATETATLYRSMYVLTPNSLASVIR